MKVSIQERSLSLSLAVALVAPLASVISMTTHAADAAVGAEELEEVIVTGTAIRGVAPTGSAVLNISREELLDAPVREASEIIRNLPQGSGLGFSEVVGTGNNNSRSSGVNLRGLGGNATLVLFDGHRLAGQGVINQFADPNQIPFAAIERVEIVTDGASAIYGSDAVAGVVNYIMRRDYQGAEVSVRHVGGNVTGTTAADFVGGFNFNGGKGNLMVGLTSENRDGFLRGEIPYLGQDLRPYGGNDNRRVGTSATPGTAGNIVLGTQIYGIPAVASGIPTAAQILANANNPNLADSAQYTSYLPDRDRLSGVLRARYKFNDRVEVSYNLLASKRKSTFQQLTPVTITVPSSSPLYITGLSPTNATYSVVYNPNANGAPNIGKPYETVVNHTLDVTVNLARDWQFTGSLVDGRTQGCGVCGPENNNTFPGSYATTDPTLFNPYLTGPQPAGQGRLIGTTYQRTWITLRDAVARVEGPVADLPGGKLRVSLGGEYAKHDHKLWLNQNIRNYTNTFQTIRDTYVDRKITSGFLEAFVPLFGAGNARPGLQKLDLSLAVRYDRYSDFGNTTNPKIGVTWKPTPGLDVRGTWGKAFRAPTLTESNPQTISLLNRVNFTNGSGDASLPITDVTTGSTLMFQRVGNTAGLQPETAKVWSLGFDLEPQSVAGLRVSATYYGVNYKDRIEAVPNATAALATAANRALYAPFIFVAPQPATCVPGNFATYNPILVALFSTPFQNNLGSPLQDCLARGYVESGQQNLGDLNQSGLDLSVAYKFDTAVGKWQLGSSVAKILKLEKAFIRNGPISDVKDTIGFQVGTRGTADIAWQRDRLSANLTVNYVGSYLNNTPITVAGVRQANSTVPAWTTLDAGVAYTVRRDAGNAGLLSGLRVSASVQNLTDKDPPIVLAGTNAIDPLVHNPYGRMLTLEASKRF